MYVSVDSLQRNSTNVPHLFVENAEHDDTDVTRNYSYFFSTDNILNSDVKIPFSNSYLEILPKVNLHEQQHCKQVIVRVC
jgi:hypothetical protein